MTLSVIIPTHNTRALVESCVRSVLAHAGGNVSQAARILGIDRVTLYAKIRKYGLKRAEDGEFEPATPDR